MKEKEYKILNNNEKKAIEDEIKETKKYREIIIKYNIHPITFLNVCKNIKWKRKKHNLYENKLRDGINETRRINIVRKSLKPGYEIFIENTGKEKDKKLHNKGIIEDTHKTGFLVKFPNYKSTLSYGDTNFQITKRK